MKKLFCFALALVLALPVCAQGKAHRKAHRKVNEKVQDKVLSHIKPYGFIRNYGAFDTREVVAGTEDFFLYIPKDRNLDPDTGKDLNEVCAFRYAALTSRLGIDVMGYEISGWKIGAKIEADFYAGVSGVTGTATFRLRQAYATLAKDGLSMKFGQAWHPMAVDIADVFSLNGGSPFGPFSRTPQITVEYNFNKTVSITGSAIWQMQYCSSGPEGSSANYIKYGCTPEFYLGLNFKNKNFLARIGADLLSISPRHTGNVKDRITTVSPFAYIQYKKDKFSIKAKTIFAQAGEHMNLNGGYGVTARNEDGRWEYTPTRNSSSWVSLVYGSKWQGQLFLGYAKNFGTAKPLLGHDSANLFFSKNSFSNMNSLWRVTPSVAYNLGKMTFGLEYELTGAQYGEWGKNDVYGLATQNLHWVLNNRVLLMIKFSF